MTPRRTLTAAATVLAATLATATPAHAHPVRCSSTNTHWQHLRTLNNLKLKPGTPGLTCATPTPTLYRLKITGPHHAYIQTVTVLGSRYHVSRLIVIRR